MLISHFLITYTHGQVLCHSESACLHKTVNMVVFSIKITSQKCKCKELPSNKKRESVPKLNFCLTTLVNGSQLSSLGIFHSELIEANKRYKAEIRRLSANNIPIETTAIGRIQKLLRKIMLNAQGLPIQGNKQVPSDSGEDNNTLRVDTGTSKPSSRRGSFI